MKTKIGIHRKRQTPTSRSDFQGFIESRITRQCHENVSTFASWTVVRIYNICACVDAGIRDLVVVERLKFEASLDV
jgi:hypothetical protein